MSRLPFLSRATFAGLTTPVARAFLRAGLTADMVTIIGTAGAVLAALTLFPAGHLFAGTLIAWFFVHFDMVDGAGVPCAPIYSIDQVVKDPHIAGDRKMFVETEHPVAGKITLTGSHLKLSETCTDIRTPSPALGQDNENVYGEMLGFSPEKVAELRAEGVL